MTWVLLLASFATALGPTLQYELRPTNHPRETLCLYRRVETSMSYGYTAL